MSYTYQQQNTDTPLETYEWDSPWWEQAPDKTKKRVMYIGDSISCDIRGVATHISKGEFLFDGFGTSKALDNPYFKQSVSLFAKQEGYRNIILFNNGLHGWHLDETEYEKYYDDFIVYLKNEFSDTPIGIVLTTNLPKDPERDITVVKRNDIAKKIAKKYDCKVIDLYAVSQSISDMHDDDGVHFKGEGSRKLAEYMLETIRVTAKENAESKQD